MEQFLNRITHGLRTRQDIVLAVFVVSVIGMMIVPLPTWLIDVLIGLNISISVVLLMVAVYLRTPLDFASFPAVLLISTLFRLSLSISTTRLILLDADAGHIVTTFGEFVAGGNLVVGLVIFLILTIVNFIVITKGAERVAEVGARFSLDAMPGRQLSIDADLRAGAITQSEAKVLRSKVGQESKLLGSMDGAMKFVKGDAIASLIIVGVNLLGGLAIGIFQKDLSAGQALHVFAILSIGDGLVAQIPALFISICAGIIVTRVSDDAFDTNLAKDISNQVMKQPKALTIGAVMLLLFAFVPGFPSSTFVGLSFVFGIPAILAFMAKRKEEQTKDAPKPLDILEDPKEAQMNRKDFSIDVDSIYSPTTQLLIEIAPNLEKHFSNINLRTEINKVRLPIYFRLGVDLPPIDVRRSTALPDNHYRIFVHEIPSADGEVVPNSLLILEDIKNLDLYDIPYQTKSDMIPRLRSVWVDKLYEPQLKEQNMRYKTEVEAITYHAEFVLAKHVASFVGVQETKTILSRMEAKFPDLSKEAQRVVPLMQMTDLFKRLVQEFVSIRDIRTIFQAMIEWGSKEKDPVVLTEHIRIALARQISHQYSNSYNVLSGILLDSGIEDTIRSSIRQTSSGNFMQLDPEVSKKILARIRETAMPVLSNGAPCALITAMDVRRYLRRLVESDLPELPVLSYQELSTDITLQPVARVTV
jgi:type III secretion protein V